MMYIPHGEMLLIAGPKPKRVHGRGRSDQGVPKFHGVTRVKPGEIFTSSLADDFIYRNARERGEQSGDRFRLRSSGATPDFRAAHRGVRNQHVAFAKLNPSLDDDRVLSPKNLDQDIGIHQYGVGHCKRSSLVCLPACSACFSNVLPRIADIVAILPQALIIPVIAAFPASGRTDGTYRADGFSNQFGHGGTGLTSAQLKRLPHIVLKIKLGAPHDV